MKAKRKTTPRRDREETNVLDFSSLPDLFGVRVSGNCLSPVIKNDDAVFFDKRQPVQVGDIVGVFFKPGLTCSTGCMSPEIGSSGSSPW